MENENGISLFVTMEISQSGQFCDIGFNLK